MGRSWTNYFNEKINSNSEGEKDLLSIVLTTSTNSFWISYNSYYMIKYDSLIISCATGFKSLTNDLIDSLSNLILWVSSKLI